MFQSPCGEKVIENHGRKYFYWKDKVSIPLRGEGHRKLGLEGQYPLNNDCTLFQSPCGEKVIENPIGMKHLPYIVFKVRLHEDTDNQDVVK